MKFKIEPDDIGYFLYVEIDGEWKLLGFRYTFIGAKFAAWQYKRRCSKAIEFKI